MVRLQMSMRTPVMAVSSAELDTDQIQHAVPDAALSDHFLRKFAHSLYRTLEHHCFNALVMIQMRMHRGKREVVVSVLNTGQSLGQFALMMVVHVRQIGDACAFGIAFLGVLLKVATQNVAYRLTAIRISAFFDERIECCSEAFIKGYRESIHPRLQKIEHAVPHLSLQ